MRRLILTFATLLALTATAHAEAYEPEGWRKKAIPLVAESSRVTGVHWRGPHSLWFTVNDKSNITAWACLRLTRAGMNRKQEFVVIRALDHDDLVAGHITTVGKGLCGNP